MHYGRLDAEEALPWLLAAPASLFGVGSLLSVLRGDLVEGAGFAVLAVLMAAVGGYFWIQLRGQLRG